jgi:hypothetical protein
MMEGAALQLELNADESNVDIWQRLGSPDYPIQAIVTVRDTAIITGLTTGAMVAGSIVRLENLGYILGHGGDGGDGQEGPPTTFPATPGTDGETAFTMTVPVFLSMTTGHIWGGGGGGGGGTGAPTDEQSGGGGGGVEGGAAGIGDGTAQAGGIGITATPGAGATSPYGDGGDGGDWGQSGQAGEGGVAGGNGGLSIDKGGFTLTYVELDEAALISGGFIKGVVA